MGKEGTLLIGISSVQRFQQELPGGVLMLRLLQASQRAAEAGRQPPWGVLSRPFTHGRRESCHSPVQVACLAGPAFYRRAVVAAIVLCQSRLEGAVVPVDIIREVCLDVHSPCVLRHLHMCRVDETRTLWCIWHKKMTSYQKSRTQETLW